MKAATWTGVNEVSVEDVPEPQILNNHDVILTIHRTVTCGSDLHLLGGYIPFMRAGDVLGHEFVGEIVEVGPAVRQRKVGDRVVVPSFIACGNCWYCKQELYSLCERGELVPDHLATHMMPLTDAPRGYRMFKEEDGCVRAVFLPHG